MKIYFMSIYETIGSTKSQVNKWKQQAGYRDQEHVIWSSVILYEI